MSDTTRGAPTQWVRLYDNPNPALSTPAITLREVPFEADDITAHMQSVFQNSYEWFVRPSSLMLALVVGMGEYKTYELRVESRNTRKTGFLWFTLRSGAAPLTAKQKTLPAYADRVTARLMKEALPRHGKDECPRCGYTDLHFYRTALRCSRCLTLAGGF